MKKVDYPAHVPILSAFFLRLAHRYATSDLSISSRRSSYSCAWCSACGGCLKAPHLVRSISSFPFFDPHVGSLFPVRITALTLTCEILDYHYPDCACATCAGKHNLFLRKYATAALRGSCSTGSHVASSRVYPYHLTLRIKFSSS